MDLQTAFQTAAALHQSGRLSEAAALYDRILEAAPDHPETLYLRGTVDLQQQRFNDALARFDRVVQLAPGHAGAHANRAATLLALRKFEAGLESSARALALKPMSPNVLANRAALLNNLGRRDEALASADQALVISAGHQRALEERATALHGLGRLPEALAANDRATAGSEDPDLLVNRSAILLDMERYEEALKACDRAISRNPKLALVHNNRGNALAALQRMDEAIAAFDRALALTPESAITHVNRANAYRSQGNNRQALAGLTRALKLDPRYISALIARSAVLRESGKQHEAIADCNRALAIDGDCLEALISRAYSYAVLRQLDAALADLERAQTLAPASRQIAGDIVFWRLQTAQWEGLEDRISICLDTIDHSDTPFAPFTSLVLPTSLEQRRKVAARHFAVIAPHIGHHRWPKPRPGKIRVGYFSGDLFTHATAYLTAGMFEAHDRKNFEIVAFSFGGEENDPMRMRLKMAFDRFIDISNLSDIEVANLARKTGIDIAIDLKGHTLHSRPAIFAHGTAPLQVNYLGFPGTLGTPKFDYIIGDSIVTPDEHQPYYAEKIVALPHSYQPNDATRAIAARAFTRTELCLPEAGFVFCAFNNTFKILPQVFDLWSRILKAVPGSVLWLLEDNVTASRNLRHEAQKRDLDPARLVFAPRMPTSDHLARQKAADLFLDTQPYGAHTTASDALWVGLPVLTQRGEAFAGRVAASLLTAANLPDLIVENEAAYESRAVALATNPQMLVELKQTLAAGRLSCPLFDTARYTRNLEAAYRHMWERHMASLPPEAFHVIEGQN